MQSCGAIDMNITGRLFVVAGLLFASIQPYAQSRELPGDAALQRYYSDLDAKLAQSRLSDVPFEQVSLVVNAKDSLVKLAKKHTFAQLDFLHLAVAIYQINPSAFENGDPALLNKGAVLQMPDAGDLIEAKYQYERVTVERNWVSFFGGKNVMRAGVRYPLGRKPETKTKPEPKLKSKPKPEPKSELESKPKPKPKPEPKPEPEPEPEPVVVSGVETANARVNWDVSLWGERRAFTEHIEKLAELVAAKTNGEFVLNLSYGGLAKPTENLDGIASGKFEMAQFCAGYHHDKNPSLTVLELPFLGVQSLEEERTISQWLYRHPAVIKDLARWNAVALMPSPLPQYNIAGVGKAPQALKDFAGLSIRATGGIGKAVAAINAIPNPTTASEVRQALDDGLIEAAAFAPHAHVSFGTIETADWWTTNLNPGTVNCPVVAGVDAVNELAPRYRDALYSSINAALDYYIANYNGNTLAAWGPALEQRGITQITFSDSEVDAFRARVAGPAAASWIEENASPGLPAQELYDFVTVALSGGSPESVGTAWSSAEVAGAPLVAANFTSQVNDEDNYLGPPRNGKSNPTLTADPLQYLVEWELQGNVSVGAALSRLASYIGYELSGGNNSVQNNHKRLLPLLHRSVAVTTVGDGFEVLSGAGFVTVFDHAARSITQLPKKNRKTKQNLRDCPTDISVATQSSEGVLLLPDGSECRY